MKTKMNRFFTAVFAAIVFSLVMTSCESDNLPDTPGGDKEKTKGVYILNNGQWDKNNSTLSYYSIEEPFGVTKNVFYTKNKKKIGDLGQVLIRHEEEMFLLVLGSSVLYQLDMQGKLVNSVLLDESYSSPRDVFYDNEKLYITFWDGSLVRYNAKSLVEEAKLPMGKNLEKIVKIGNKLYISDIGFAQENKVFEVDIADFKLTKTIEVEYNPNDLYVVNGNLMVCSWGKNNDKCSLQMIAIADKSYAVTPVADAKYLVQKDNLLYLVYTMTNFVTNKVENRFLTYDLKTSRLSEESFIKEIPQSLKDEAITFFDYDTKRHDFYIGTSPDYTSNGYVYRFDEEGGLKDKFNSEGVLPMDIVFF